MRPPTHRHSIALWCNPEAVIRLMVCRQSILGVSYLSLREIGQASSFGRSESVRLASMLKCTFILALALIVVGCATQTDGSNFDPPRGLARMWAWTMCGLTGVLLPDLVSERMRVLNRETVRLLSGAMLLFSSTFLTYYYLGWSVIDLLFYGSVLSPYLHPQ